MSDVVAAGDAIEGLGLDGSSREELLSRGLQVYRKQRCYRFIAVRDVHAQVSKPVSSACDLIFEPTALIETDAQVRCQRVVLHSLDCAPKLSVQPRTGAHKANFWDFRKQTAAKIDQAHQSIMHALQNRARLLSR